MDELIGKAVALFPALAPLAAFVVMLVALRSYLYKGYVRETTMEKFFALKGEQNVAIKEITEKLGGLSGCSTQFASTIQALKEDIDELRHLMYEHNTATKEQIAGLLKRQNDIFGGCKYANQIAKKRWFGSGRSDISGKRDVHQ